MFRSSVLMALLALVCMAFGSPLQAQTADGVTPADEDVCDALRDGDYTKGLYGLCVAYCEAEARSDAVLENYERKRQEGDPDMPCITDSNPAPTCPCWTSDTVAAASQLVPFVCQLGDTDQAVYSEFDLENFTASYELFEASDSGCHYLYDANSFDGLPADIDLSMSVSTVESGACRTDLSSLCGGGN